MFDASSYGTACFLFILQIFWFTEVTASPTKCANADVTVYAELKADIPFVCAAAENTFSFLIKAGLKKRVHIELHIVEEMKELPFRNLYFGLFMRSGSKELLCCHTTVV